jgi:hypothetical protein
MRGMMSLQALEKGPGRFLVLLQETEDNHSLREDRGLTDPGVSPLIFRRNNMDMICMISSSGHRTTIGNTARITAAIEKRVSQENIPFLPAGEDADQERNHWPSRAKDRFDDGWLWFAKEPDPLIKYRSDGIFLPLTGQEY